MLAEEPQLSRLKQRLQKLRGSNDQPAAASVIIPVNAKADLQKVVATLQDVARYEGRHNLEVILVINNYDLAQPPPEIREFQRIGIRVVSVPSAARAGEVVIVSARELGVEAAQSEVTIHFDADCQIPDPTSLLDWMIDTLESRGDVCYSPVKFYDYSSQLSVRTKLGIHHAARWAKRNLFRIPTTRGSNYAIRRSWFLRLYAEGKLSVDMQVGQAAKLAGARVVYCGDSRLAVLTSGRRFRGGWLKIPRYFLYRLRYNLHAVPVKGREVTRTSWSGFDQESQTRTQTH